MDYQDFEKLYRKDPNMAPPLLTKNMDFCLSSGSLYPRENWRGIPAPEL